jgi:hypothetical protein
MWLSIRKRLTARGTKSGFTAFRRHSAIRWRGVEFRSDFCCLFLIVFNNLKYLATRAEQLPSLGKQPGVLGEVGDELPHVVTLHLEAQGPDGTSSLPVLPTVEVGGFLRANRQLGGDPRQATAREGLDLLQGGVDLADGTVRTGVNATDAPQAREVCQHKAQISARLALTRGKLRAS